MAVFGENRRGASEIVNRFTNEGTDSATASLEAERDMLVGILETLSQSRHMNEYLERLVEQVRNYSGCRSIGIRLLDDEGDIPYVAYSGFSRRFYELESPLCINVIIAATDPQLPFYTEGGSFFSKGMTKSLASVPEGVRGPVRDICPQFGYESVALVPMRHRGRILGLIHLAEEGENGVPLAKVRFLEQVGGYIGEALHTFLAEEALRQSEANYRTLVESSPDGVLSLDIEGHIVDGNEGVCQLLGYAKEELKGRDWGFWCAGGWWRPTVAGSGWNRSPAGGPPSSLCCL